VKRLLTLALAAAVLALPSCQTEKVTSDKGPDGPNPVVELKTNMGDIEVELFQDRSPGTVKNFLGYVDEHFYDGTIFHRVIPDFMVQAGAFEPGMRRERPTRPPIKGEAGNNLPNLRGTLAMGLRPGDPDSGTSQFYVNLKHNQHLDGKHTVFGVVRGQGMSVVDKIAAVETHDVGGHEAVPVKDVVILSARRIDSADAKPSK